MPARAPPASSASCKVARSMPPVVKFRANDGYALPEVPGPIA
jgi:hypothetical protein